MKNMMKNANFVRHNKILFIIFAFYIVEYKIQMPTDEVVNPLKLIRELI